LATLNVNVPRFYCFLRKEFLYDGEARHGELVHVIALDNGNFAAQPNNRIQWFCPAFVTPFHEKPDYVTNTKVWKVERETETTQAFFYETVGGDAQVGPVSLYLYVKGLRTHG